VTVLYEIEANEIVIHSALFEEADAFQAGRADFVASPSQRKPRQRDGAADRQRGQDACNELGYRGVDCKIRVLARHRVDAHAQN